MSIFKQNHSMKQYLNVIFDIVVIKIRYEYLIHTQMLRNLYCLRISFVKKKKKH